MFGVLCVDWHACWTGTHVGDMRSEDLLLWGLGHYCGVVGGGFGQATRSFGQLQFKVKYVDTSGEILDARVLGCEAVGMIRG